MPRSELHKRLRPIQTRMHRLAVFRSAMRALMIGSVLALLLAVLRLVGLHFLRWWASIGPLLMVIVAISFALWRKPSWIKVAREVDQSYRLKDRALTAVCLTEKSDLVPLQQLQIDDAIGHLQTVSPTRVVPRVMPKALPFACLLLLAAWLLLALPLAAGKGDGDAKSVNPKLASLAAELEQELVDPLRRLAQTNRDREAKLEKHEWDSGKTQSLNDLTADLAQMVNEMKLPGVDSREALAKLSDIQARLADAQKRWDLSHLNPSMQELGQVLQQADAMQSAGRALEDLDYLAAAQHLDEFQPEKVSARERAKLSTELKQLADEIREQDQTNLAKFTDELSDGFKQDDDLAAEGKLARQKSSAASLADLSRQLAARKALVSSLAKQKAKINEAKGVARSGGTSQRPTKQPRKTWGRGSSPESLHQPATDDLASQRKRENLTGMAGNGPSEKEFAGSAVAAEVKRLEYEKRYEEFERAAEGVLEQEALPLGHRQTIREYFDAIKPD
ncbi:MAG: hypothetical protein GY768_20425 [Planctomycetaceae bacterium]|nr:hypothetical protein [Planctomycetaceae bacterium]